MKVNTVTDQMQHATCKFGINAEYSYACKDGIMNGAGLREGKRVRPTVKHHNDANGKVDSENTYYDGYLVSMAEKCCHVTLFKIWPLENLLSPRKSFFEQSEFLPKDPKFLPLGFLDFEKVRLLGRFYEFDES